MKLKQLNLPIIALFIFIVVSWGFAWPINKLGLIYMTPMWYTVSRLMIGTLTMMIFVICTKQFVLPTKADMPLILIIGLLQISLYILFANIGLRYLPAGRASLLAYTTPLWVMPITILFFQEKPLPLHWFGFCLGTGGLLILLSPWQMNWHDVSTIFGSGMLLLASLSWAISIICTRYMSWNRTPMQLIPWQLLIGTIPIFLVACVTEPIVSITWHRDLILSLAYSGILVTGLSYWSGVVITKELPTILTSLGFLAVPVFSLIVSAIFMHEPIHILTAAAITLILMGLACVALPKKEKAV